jgi:hypothetical protein
VDKSYSVNSVAKAVREYEGVTRKHSIGAMIKSLKLNNPDVIASLERMQQ